MGERSLKLTGMPNARDLGGYLTADGRKVSSGLLYRSDALCRATDGDVLALGDLRLVRVLDLRGDLEVGKLGADRLPTADPPDLVRLPLYDPALDIYGMMIDAAAVAQLTPAHARELMHELYRWFVTGPNAREQFATAIRHIADPDGLPLLFHCTAGKDRTGWLAAVVLTALGVDRDTVYADYELTNELFTTGPAALGRRRLLDAFAATFPDPSVLMPLLDADAAYLTTAFDAVTATYGTLDAYLRDGLGLDDTVLSALRANLLA